MNKSILVLLAAVAATGITYGAATNFGQSKWKEHYVNAEKMLQANPNNLQAVEDELMKSIECAFKDRVPEKQIVHVYAKMGDIMTAEGKYEESQKYFLRQIQFNNALNVDADENIAQLKKLENAYEKARDYESAEQTQRVLVNLIEFEKSPYHPTFAGEKAKLEELKVKLAKFMNPADLPAKQVAENQPTVQEQRAQENLLTGWH
jgi:tetratricopeptide (TPR) repeat protein